MSVQTQALEIKRQEHKLVLTGNAVRDRLVSVIEGRFRHRNDDGTIFRPRIAGSLLWPGVAQVVVVDPNRLWHFSIARMTNQDTINLMEIATGRPVRAIRKIPAGAMGNREAREVLAYAVLLKDNLGAPSPAAKATLPKMSARSNFDASLIPAGDYMLPISNHSS